MHLKHVMLCFGIWICIEKTVQHKDEKEPKNKEEIKVKKSGHADDQLLMPVPPAIRQARATSRLEALEDEESKSLPKYVRLSIREANKVGHEEEIEILPGIKRIVKTLSITPRVFEVEDFLDEDECDLLIELAKRKKMKTYSDKGFDDIIHGGPDKTFYQWDLDDNGFVDDEELALLPGKNMRFTVEDAGDMIFMLKMDKNEDGKVDQEELRNTDLSKIKAYIDERKDKEDPKREMKSENAWVWHDEDELLRFQDDYYYGYHTRFTSVTGLPEEIIKESEPLQVQHFQENQFSRCRRDSDEVSDTPCCLYGETEECRNCRFITMELFLNDVEDGGELVFPLADHQFTEIINSSGEWRGYFTYAKTTGSQNRFTANLQFVKNEANQLFSGDGRDASGNFDITDGIILGNTIRFQKSYSGTPGKEASIKYSGKIISGSRILGNWWVPGKKRLFGTFFMWHRNYEVLLKKSAAKCNHLDFCKKSGLVVKPKKGKAIFWYNHEIDYQTGMLGERDNDSLYGHCAVNEGDKWIATTRINIIGDGDVDLRAWRRGFNWMQKIEKHPNVIKKIGSNKSRTKIEPYKEDFERFKFEENDDKNKTVSYPQEHKRKAPRYILNAVDMLFNVIDKEGLSTIANVVHRKLRLTCVPFYAEEKKD